MKCRSSHLVNTILGFTAVILAARCSGCLHFAMPPMDAPPDESSFEQEEDNFDLLDGGDVTDENDSSDGDDIEEDLQPLLRTWSRTYGTAGNWESFRAIDPTEDGGFIAAGFFDPVWPEASDFLVVKLDRDGDIEWQETMGGTEDDVANAVLQTGDGGYIVAGDISYDEPLYSSPWVVKLDPSGSIEWQKVYVNTAARSFSIQQTADGGYIGTGEYDNPESTGPDFWLLKLDEAGNVAWQKKYVGHAPDYSYDVRQTDDGGFIMTGMTDSFGISIPTFLVLKVDQTGEVEWGKVYTHTVGQGNPGAIRPTSDGGYILSGYDRSEVPFIQGFLVVKMDHLGNIVWQQDYDGPTFDAASILQASDGGYVLTGSGNYNTETFSKLLVIKIYPEGINAGYIEWQKSFDGPLEDLHRCAAAVPSGGYVIAGDTTSFGAGYQDAWVIRIDERGRLGQGCPPGLGEDSNVGRAFPYLTAEDASLTASDTAVVAVDTDVVPQAADLVVTTQCAGF